MEAANAIEEQSLSDPRFIDPRFEYGHIPSFPDHEETTSFPLEEKPLTRENILASLDAAPKIQHLGQTNVVRVRSDVVVKYGSHIRLGEANTMRLVRERTSIALPEVLDAWTTASPSDPDPARASWLSGPKTYIVMQYIPGTSLVQKWPLMSQDERKELAGRVADMLRQLHSIELEQPGPVGDPAVCQGFFFTDFGAGPFATKRDLEYWFDNRYEVMKMRWPNAPDRPGFVIERLVLCHMDLHDGNIIIAEDGSPWIIDWGFAGGFPPYLEQGNLPHTNGGAWTRMLEEEIHVQEYEPAISRLMQMSFAFSAGELWRRGDLEPDEAY